MARATAVRARALRKGGTRPPAPFIELNSLVNMALSAAHVKGTTASMNSAVRSWISFLKDSGFSDAFVEEAPDLADKGRPFFIPVQTTCSAKEQEMALCLFAVHLVYTRFIKPSSVNTYISYVKTWHLKGTGDRLCSEEGQASEQNLSCLRPHSSVPW